MDANLEIQAVVFDKDGTLLDFAATWNRATAMILTEVTSNDPDRLQGVATATGFDLGTGVILDGSPLIAESNAVIASLILPWSDPALEITVEGLDQIASQAAAMTLVAMAGAESTLRELHTRGIVLAVATNDSAAGAQAMIDKLGWHDLFGAAVGYDSGYGAKPEPGMVLGVLTEIGVEPEHALMVGDSDHDITAGAAAGTRTVLLAPDPADSPADHVITTLPALLDLV